MNNGARYQLMCSLGTHLSLCHPRIFLSLTELLYIKLRPTTANLVTGFTMGHGRGRVERALGEQRASARTAQNTPDGIGYTVRGVALEVQWIA